MTPLKPTRTNHSMKSNVTSTTEIQQSLYEDVDALMLNDTVGNQSDVKDKPVPRPRSKKPPKTQNNTNNTGDSAGTTDYTTNEVSYQNKYYTSEYNKPPPVRRPPPRPPATNSFTSCNPTTAINGDGQYSSNPEPIVMTPAVRTESLQNPSRPQRPLLPASYYDRPSSAAGIQSKTSTYRPQPSKQQIPVPPAPLEGEAADVTDRPAVRPPLPPKYYVLRSRPGSVCETLPSETRPPPPSFRPPPPPTLGRAQPEPVYYDVTPPSYLDVLPEDEDQVRSSSSRSLSQAPSSLSRPQTIGDGDDIITMLRWLTRMSKSDIMAPSLYGVSLEEEIRSFDQRAMNISKALRLYNLLMMKRNDGLRNIITEFLSISDSLDKMKKTSKTMGIAGGTTGAVGGVTAVVGIALAPMTMGVSLIATAVGTGMMASAGGMGAHALKTNKKSVTKMRVEKLVYDYKTDIADIERCLEFILSGMNDLRRHDLARLQRAGAHLDGLKVAHLSQTVFRNKTNNERRTSAASERLLQAFVKEMDQYFTEKDGQKLKKSIKSKFSGRVRLLAENLQDELDHLTRMWEMFS